jgi:4,5-DOPA dioxygenase extradiol
MSDADLMPAVFIGHASPRIALIHNQRTEAWRAFAASIPRPRAILAISAHWYINATAVTAMVQPRTVHDFFGASPELSAFQYPAPGDGELASRVAEVLSPAWVGFDVDSWGLDHGTWSVLTHCFPQGDIPVVQLSLDATASFDHHLLLGARLAPLRREGILVLASGAVIHNGRARGPEGRESGDYERALRFDASVAEVMTTAPGLASELRWHPDYEIGAPTDDHFLPLLYLAGLADAAGEVARALPDGLDDDEAPLTRCYSVGTAP